MTWNDSLSDDESIEAKSELCTPEKYWSPPHGPVPKDELFSYIDATIMGWYRRLFENVLLFSITGGNQDREDYTYKIIWQNPITANPAQKKGALLDAISDYDNSPLTLNAWFWRTNTFNAFKEQNE